MDSYRIKAGIIRNLPVIEFLYVFLEILHVFTPGAGYRRQEIVKKRRQCGKINTNNGLFPIAVNVYSYYGELRCKRPDINPELSFSLKNSRTQ